MATPIFMAGGKDGLIAKIGAYLSVPMFLFAVFYALLLAYHKTNSPYENNPVIPKDYRNIAIWLIVSSIAIYLAGTVAFALRYGLTDGSIWKTMEEAFLLSDANHYIEIAKNGYTAVGETRYFIVFFPLFPLLLRLCSFITLGNYFLASMLLNNACLYVGCIYLYRLTCTMFDAKAGLRAVRYTLLFPVAFFFRIPYTESLFLMTSVASVFYATQRKYLVAGIWGLFSALTRMTGVLCALPIFMQIVLDYWDNQQRQKPAVLKSSATMLLPPVGTLLYLCINKVVTGDWLKFLFYQSDHWHNGFALFPHAVETTINYLIRNTQVHHIALWLTQALFIFIMLGLLIYAALKLPPVVSLYGCAYFLMMISSAWLISGPRYLMCMFPAIIALAIPTKHKWADIAVTILFAASLLCMTALFCLRHAIY
ncbi:hypothetical protein LJC55_00895 [Eubacteriales bacterium OttesenSCG-928-N14]|nr:hypothetical protein [Eubacteriales bacterium OttesenSCG-928-N14]